MKIVHITSTQIEEQKNNNGESNCKHLKQYRKIIKGTTHNVLQLNFISYGDYKTHWHRPNGHSIVFQWEFQISHHIFSNKPFEGMDNIQYSYHCQKKYQY